MRKSVWKNALLGVMAVGSLAGSARAQQQPAVFEVQQFRPSMGRYDILGVQSAQVAKSLDWQFEGFANYATNMLKLKGTKFLSAQTGMDLGLAFGLFDFFEVSAVMPVSGALTYTNEGAALTGGDQSLWNNLRITSFKVVPKLMLFHPGKLRIGVSAPFEVPFDYRQNFIAQKGNSINPRLLIGYEGTLKVDLNAGYMLRKKQTFTEAGTNLLTTGNAITYGLGASLPIVDRAHKLEIMATVTGEYSMEKDTKDANPMEGLAALRWTTPIGVALTAGGGTRLMSGYGAPDYRILGGIAFAPPEQKPCPECEKVQAPAPAEALFANDQSARVKAGESAVNSVANSVSGARAGEFRLVKVTQPKNGRAEILPDGTVRYTPNAGFSGTDSYGYLLKDPTGRAAVGNVAVTVEPKPATKAKIEGCKIKIDEPVFFDTGKPTIMRKSDGVLDDVAGVMKDHPEIQKIRVEGHTDTKGRPAANLALSKRRAAMVKQYLVGKGIDASRIDAQGLGQTRPIASNKTEDGRAQNRRVEFNIVDCQP